MTPHRDADSPKHLFARIREVLLAEWDPLGLGAAAEGGEHYDPMARELHALLTGGGASVERIAHYLEWAEAEQLGLQRRPEAARAAARRIVALAPGAGTAGEWGDDHRG